MKRNKIVFLIYDNNLYIYKNNKIEIMTLNTSVIKNGRLNNIKPIINALNKSKLLANSLFKVINDIIAVIYFGDYNEYEIKNIVNSFSEYGFDNIKMVDYGEVINNEDETFIITTNDNIYVLNGNKKVIISSSIYNLEYAKSKIIVDNNTLKIIDKNLIKQHYYVVDCLPNYLIKKFAKRNFY